MSTPRDQATGIIRDNEAFVQALALKYAPAPGMAADIAQQVFAEFLTKVDSWDLSTDTRPLFNVMTRNVARRCWRQRSNGMSKEMRSLAEHIRTLAEQKEVTNYGEEEKQVLRKCLKKLPDKSRKIVDAHYNLDVSSTEMATRMQMTAVSVRQALFRIRSKLRKCMQASLDGSAS